ncbi:hypothetical protein EDD21DRAFT_380808 [Dissophora ornata]|nr:hypothetical protein BGZ58_006454 [Dissophora ornata]KAI8599060.1 hypothetical protein EDD21DRAFT_380808 [Dissophora ornata]
MALNMTELSQFDDQQQDTMAASMSFLTYRNSSDSSNSSNSPDSLTSTKSPRVIYTDNFHALTGDGKTLSPVRNAFGSAAPHSPSTTITRGHDNQSNEIISATNNSQQIALPSPPLASGHPPQLGSNFLSLQERCDILESELSGLRNRLQHAEQSSTLREKRLSQAQQQSSNTQTSLQTLKQQHEITLIQLSKVQLEATQSKTRLEERDAEIQQLKSKAQEQTSELKELILDRDSLSLEMIECHSDNAKFLKRLRTSNDKVDRLQDENRHLIEQLRDVRARVVEVSDEKSKVNDVLDRERQRAGQAALDLERVVARYKDEVERLQDLVLAMGRKYVRVQSQLAFIQQQAQAKLQVRLRNQLAIEQGDSQGSNQTLVTHSSSPSSNSSMSDVTPSLSSSDTTLSMSGSASQHGGLVLGDDALASILSSVAANSHSRRSKATRRFTVNASHKEAPLTLEQQKCEFLMNQITVLQRGYDSLRQEKITIELQLDLMQRQHQFHQQQQQKHRDPQRKALGSERPYQNYPESHLPTIMSGSTSSTITCMTAGTTILRSERLEEAESSMVVRDRKDLQIQEALASLESKRGRSDSRNIQISSPHELKHLEQVRNVHGPQQQEQQDQQLSSPEVHGSSSTTSTPSPLHALSFPSGLSQSNSAKTREYYTQHGREHHAHAHRPPQLREHVEWDVQQCSCCMGILIDI